MDPYDCMSYTMFTLITIPPLIIPAPAPAPGHTGAPSPQGPQLSLSGLHSDLPSGVLPVNDS